MPLLNARHLFVKFKQNHFFSTLKHSNSYFIANLFITILSFSTLPIFTFLMTTTDIGIYYVFLALSGFTIVLLSLNFYSSVARYYFEETQDFNIFLGTSLFLTLIPLALFCIIYILFEKSFDKIINLPYPLGIYLLILTLFLILESFYFQILIVKKQSTEYLILVVSKNFLIITSSIIVIYLMTNNKYLGRILPLLLFNFIFSIYYLYKLANLSYLKISKRHVKYILIYSLPLIPYAISGVILNFFDRIFINFVNGPSESGIYSIAYSIGALVSLAITSVHSAQTPEFFKLMNEKDYEKYYILARRLYHFIVLGAFALILFSKNILDIFTAKEYHSSYAVIPPIILGYLFYGLFYFYGQYIGYLKKTYLLSAIAILAGIINIILNVLLIPKIGYIAGGYTTFLSYFSLFAFSWIASKFFLKQKTVPLLSMTRPLIVITILLAFFYMFNWKLIILYEIILKSFLLLFYFLYFLMNEYLSYSKNLI